MTTLRPYTVGRRPERIDRIARALYGDEHGGVERLWSANPGLSSFGAFVPPGTIIRVPAPVAQTRSSYQVPWG